MRTGVRGRGCVESISAEGARPWAPRSLSPPRTRPAAARRDQSNICPEAKLAPKRSSVARAAASGQPLDSSSDALRGALERLHGVAHAGQVVLHLGDLAADLRAQRDQL